MEKCWYVLFPFSFESYIGQYEVTANCCNFSTYNQFLSSLIETTRPFVTLLISIMAIRSLASMCDHDAGNRHHHKVIFFSLFSSKNYYVCMNRVIHKIGIICMWMMLECWKFYFLFFNTAYLFNIWFFIEKVNKMLASHNFLAYEWEFYFRQFSLLRFLFKQTTEIMDRVMSKHRMSIFWKEMQLLGQIKVDKKHNFKLYYLLLPFFVFQSFLFLNLKCFNGFEEDLMDIFNN